MTLLIPSKSKSMSMFTVALIASCAAGAAAPTENECTATGNEIVALMEKTKVGMVTSYAGLPSEYKSDGDPETLEVVYLPKRKGVSSGVTDDGEVIFLVGKVRDAEQQRLTMLAYCRRAIARRA